MSPPPELEELGRRIRKLRTEHRMTLKQVENDSGLSATHLSEIERGRTSPTIGALMRIARTLEKHPSFFIEAQELSDVARVLRHEARAWGLSPGVTARALTPGIPGGELFAYLLEFRAAPPSEWRLPSQTQPADALYLVTRGTIEMRFGERTLALSSGDAAQASLSTAHHLRALSGEATELLALLTRPLEKNPMGTLGSLVPGAP